MASGSVFQAEIKKKKKITNFIHLENFLKRKNVFATEFLIDLILFLWKRYLFRDGVTLALRFIKGKTHFTGLKFSRVICLNIMGKTGLIGLNGIVKSITAKFCLIIIERRTWNHVRIKKTFYINQLQSNQHIQSQSTFVLLSVLSNEKLFSNSSFDVSINILFRISILHISIQRVFYIVILTHVVTKSFEYFLQSNRPFSLTFAVVFRFYFNLQRLVWVKTKKPKTKYCQQLKYPFTFTLTLVFLLCSDLQLSMSLKTIESLYQCNRHKNSLVQNYFSYFRYFRYSPLLLTLRKQVKTRKRQIRNKRNMQSRAQIVRYFIGNTNCFLILFSISNLRRKSTWGVSGPGGSWLSSLVGVSRASRVSW